MAHLSSLSNSRTDRKIREVIENGEETIYVYEPSADDVDYIIDIHDRLNDELATLGEISITGEMMVKEIFPRLTNIKGIDEMTDDEIAYVIANPSIAMLQVQHMIEIIVTQVYKTVILSAKRSILDADFKAGTTSYIGGIADRAMALHASTDEKAAKILHKLEDKFEIVEDLQKVVEEFKPELVQDKVGINVEDEQEVDTTMSEYDRKILQYRQNFTNKEGNE